MLGCRPAARACMAWARPISPPSTVTTELLDMFCALNGATRSPLRASNRHRPATTMDLPASELVPATSSAPLTWLWRADAESHDYRLERAILRLLARAKSQLGQDFGAGVGDEQRVLELSTPLAVLGNHRPPVVPDFVVQRTKVDHRLDGERHPWLEDGGDRGLVVVQHDQPVVKRGADVMPGEITNDVVAEPVCVGLDYPADHRQRTARFDRFDRAHHRLASALHQQP